MNKEQVLECLDKCAEALKDMPLHIIDVSIYEGKVKVLVREEGFMEYTDTSGMPRTFETYYINGVDTGNEFVTATADNGVELHILRKRP